jgi:hypothetical protein
VQQAKTAEQVAIFDLGAGENRYVARYQETEGGHYQYRSEKRGADRRGGGGGSAQAGDLGRGRRGEQTGQVALSKGFNAAEARDPHGRWTGNGSGSLPTDRTELHLIHRLALPRLARVSAARPAVAVAAKECSQVLTDP